MDWKEFEIDCYNYLESKYGNNKIKFIYEGSSDSNAPDIKVFISDEFVFNIEIKSKSAQSGQFVLIPNDKIQIFEYSTKNKYKENQESKEIIKSMNLSFEKYRDAGSAGENINLDKRIFYKWIIGYYKDKNVKFFITEQNNRKIIFPISKFDEYFDVSATYRMKKSGSSRPTKGDFKEIINIVGDKKAKIKETLDKVVIESEIDLNEKKIEGKTHTFYFKVIKNNEFMIRRLSNTRNSNVIFSINLKKDQQKVDLDAFESIIG